MSGLELDNHGSLYDEIEAMLAHNERAIPDPDLPFPLDGETTAAKFGKKSACIDSLEKTRAERLVDTPGRLHDLPYKSIDFPRVPHRTKQCKWGGRSWTSDPDGIAASGWKSRGIPGNISDYWPTLFFAEVSFFHAGVRSNAL